MDLVLIDVQKLYEQDKKLREEDVKTLLDWVHKQPHLPKINELQAATFLHSCYYKNEAAKTTIDNFFTFRTSNPDYFEASPQLATDLDICLITTLPKKTPQGYTVVLIKILDSNIDKFHFPMLMRYAEMVMTMHFYQEGCSPGYVGVLDFEGITFAHVTKVGLSGIRAIFYYLQEALPIRLKGVHFHNTPGFMDKVLTLIKPMMKKEVAEMLHLHATNDSLAKFLPLECLPKDYGGLVEPIEVLHEKIVAKIDKSAAFFEWNDTFVVDEKRRLEKRESNDLLGIDGTFKKLELD